MYPSAWCAIHMITQKMRAQQRTGRLVSVLKDIYSENAQTKQIQNALTVERITEHSPENAKQERR